MSHEYPTNPAIVKRASIAAVTVTAATAAILWGSTSSSAQNRVDISVQGGKRCVTSNGLPNHGTGRFPNSGNPHTISAQNIKLCFPANPRKGHRARAVRGSIGVALNGVQFRPGTADYYDPSSRRGFSRNRGSGWNLEGLGARDKLGMDRNNAHVDERGLYHYHGVASALVRSSRGSLIGYAADGFEIHYVGGSRRSSYRLKKGTRPSGPGGPYDGTYNEDWHYVAGSGNLDRCNGGRLNGKFVYFATNTYPFLPRCLWGNVSSDFRQGRGRGPRNAAAERPRRRTEQARRGSQRDRGSNRRSGPPQQAIAACTGRSRGASCSFTAPGRSRQVTGACNRTPRGTVACVPSRRRPRS